MPHEPPEPRVAWEAQLGSQAVYLSCPVFEVLYEGTRGVGKTVCLLMDFAQHVGEGHGAHWKGIIFRREARTLVDVIEHSQEWFPKIFPDAQFVQAPTPKWTFRDGEVLRFLHIWDKRDYGKYHGWGYPFVGFEELTLWPDLQCYHQLKSICRSATPGVPLKYRATTNPSGIGHNAVKAYFVDPAPAGTIIRDEHGLERVRIHGHMSENQILMGVDPGYPARIASSASSPQQRKAWMDGDWDIVAGGMFDDVWNRDRHVLQRFTPPEGWRIDRSFDWGSTKPFSVIWWGESDGSTPVTYKDGTEKYFPRGSLIAFAEWYGSDGSPNVGIRMADVDIGAGIVQREKDMGIRPRVRPGPADSSIWTTEPGQTSIGDALKKAGAAFVPADKSKGSRVNGWEVVRRMLKEAAKPRPESPGMWVTDNCTDWIRTVPTLPRDERNPDDVDTEAEDHCGDCVRYRARVPRRTAQRVRHRV